MERRLFLKAAGTGLALTAARPVLAAPAQENRTKWIVRGSEGFDALAFLSPLSGDPFYARLYPSEVEQFAPRLSQATLADLKSLKAEVAASDGLMSPAFYLYFSGGPDRTIEDLLVSLQDPERILRPSLAASPYWSKDGWNRFRARGDRVRALLVALRDAGFRTFRDSIYQRTAATKVPQLLKKLVTYDVVSGAEFYTGRTFDPTIELILTQFTNPHGIKVIGQRFLNGIDYPDEVAIRNAGHEILHPPVDMDGAAAKAVKAILERDPLLQRILRERDKSFGYGSIPGLFNEGLVKALDQLISERLEVAENPRARWRSQDGGIHVLAAAFYGLMRQDGYAKTGGNLEQWLMQKVRAGALAPAPLHQAAAGILEYPPDQLWPPPKAA